MLFSTHEIKLFILVTCNTPRFGVSQAFHIHYNTIYIYKSLAYLMIHYSNLYGSLCQLFFNHMDIFIYLFMSLQLPWVFFHSVVLMTCLTTLVYFFPFKLICYELVVLQILHELLSCLLMSLVKTKCMD